MLTTSEFLTLMNQFKKIYDDRMNRVAAEYDMSKIEVDVLLFLFNNPQFHTAKEIVEFRHIAKSYVSKAIDLLVKRGYLTVEEDKKDRRVSQLSIKKNASDVICQAKAVQESIMQVLFKGITQEERRAFEGMVQKMAENMKMSRWGEK